MLTGFRSKTIENRTKVTPATMQDVGPYRTALDTLALNYTYEVISGTFAAGSSTTSLNITSIQTSAKVGDILYITSGVAIGESLHVLSVSTNSVTIAQVLSVAPSNGDAFSLRRLVHPKTDASGQILVTGAVTTTTTPSSRTPSVPASASIGVTSAQILAANANRKGLHLKNTSANTISLGFAAPAVLNSGITLGPNDAFWTDDGCLTLGAINAIASVASSNLAIQEFA